MKNFKKYKKILLLGLFFIFLLSSGFCFAQGAPNIPQPPTGEAATLPAYLTYIFNIAFSFGIAAVMLSMLVSGVFFFLSSFSATARAQARDRLTGAASGFLILVFTYLIVTAINPQLNAFNSIKPQPAQKLQSPDTTLHGVYFYQGSNCSGTSYPSSTSIPDFNAFITKSISSSKIVQDTTNNIYHIALVYSQKNYFGACQYLNPNSSCNAITIPQINSASIYTYGTAQNSVFLYRKAAVEESGSDFYRDGGYLEIKSSDINKIYWQQLKNLKFIDPSAKTNDNPDGCTVPKDEQDCVNWDKNGKCTQKSCPNLLGTNLSAIQIQGNYLVVLVYYDSSKDKNNQYSFCQAYPSVDDVNKYGPKQIKWDAIKNNISFYPNYILIVPLSQNQ